MERSKRSSTEIVGCARACYPGSIIARSVLASSTALVVTVCILSSIVGWIVLGPKVKLQGYPAFWFEIHHNDSASHNHSNRMGRHPLEMAYLSSLLWKT